MGFVSNSSSSSFCVLKADIPDRKLFEMDDSGISEEMAMDNHLLIVKKLNHLIIEGGSF